MRILGIIAEYNPFHNGHKYHLYKSIENSNATHTIAIMSGNFVQRGEPALLDKWTRARIAIDNGINLVIELPTINAISSAENFALGSVELLDKLGVESIIFGSESANLNAIEKTAAFLANESEDYQSKLLHYLNKGVSFPVARESVLLDLGIVDSRLFSNDILGIEYIKAIKRLNSKVGYNIIKRQSVDYHSTELINEFSSATAIRNWIENDDFTNVLRAVPTVSYSYIEDYQNFVFLKDFYSIFRYSVLSKTNENLSNIYEISEGFENRILKSIKESTTMDEFLEKVKTKRFTMTRIKRIMINTLLNITKNDVKDFNLIHPKYIRILGSDQKGLEIIRKLKNDENLPIITNLSKFKSNDTLLLKQLNYDLKASDLFSIIQKTGFGQDYKQTPYIKKL